VTHIFRYASLYSSKYLFRENWRREDRDAVLMDVNKTSLTHAQSYLVTFCKDRNSCLIPRRAWRSVTILLSARSEI